MPPSESFSPLDAATVLWNTWLGVAESIVSADTPLTRVLRGALVSPPALSRPLVHLSSHRSRPAGVPTSYIEVRPSHFLLRRDFLQTDLTRKETNDVSDK